MIKNTKRGPGAAHIGFAMFGARGPLLAPEDGGTGSNPGSGSAAAAPAAEPTTTAAGGQSDPATAPGGTSEKMLPQSQVNALIAKEKRDAYERAQREFEQKTATAQAPAKVEPKTEADRLRQLEAKLEESEMRRAFDKSALRHNVPDDAAEDLFELYKAQKPSSVSEWMEAKVSRFGLKQPAQAPAATAATTATATDPAKASPAAAPAAPSAHALPTTHGGIVDLFNLNRPQLQALGPQGVRENLEKLWKIGNQMSGMPQRPKPPQRT